MKKCNNCGAQMDDDSLFCTECGKPIPQGRVCPHCGASVNNDDAFCQNCGKRADDVVTPSVPKPIMNVCPHCGATMNDSDMFCQNCGKSKQNNGNNNTSINRGVYQSPKSSSMNNILLPLVIVGGLLLLALIGGGGWWYYNCSKQKTEVNTIPQDKSVAISDTDMEEAVADDIEEAIDSREADKVESDMAFVNKDYSISEDIDVAADDIENDEMIRDALRQAEECAENKETESRKVFDIVEQMPSYPGGDEALTRFLNSNVHYPEVAEQNGIQGRVIVTFVVERDGSITDVRVSKGVDPSLNKEAVRVIKSMPRWEPGTLNGKTVRVKYTVPVTFRLVSTE